MIKDNFIIELIVNNHSGVMSHITGLFSRRGFNLEGIFCMKIGIGEKSKMYLLVDNNERIDQIIKQLEKLYDVLKVKLIRDDEHQLFQFAENFISILG